MVIAVPGIEHVYAQGGVREVDIGSGAAGALNEGQVETPALHVMVPPALPLAKRLPDTPKVEALTSILFPVVLKLPLSTIPHFGAFRNA